MKGNQTIAVYFVLRANQKRSGKAPIYARIWVNRQVSEFTLKKVINREEWHEGKMARPLNNDLKQLNNYLEAKAL